MITVLVDIYMLVDPTGAPTCYVGQTTDRKTRYRNHLSNRSSKATDKWIRSLRENGLKPKMIILDTCTRQEAEDAERDIICMTKAIRGEACLNAKILGPSIWGPKLFAPSPK